MEVWNTFELPFFLHLQHRQLHSLKLTAKAPENRPSHREDNMLNLKNTQLKRKIIWTKPPFLGFQPLVFQGVSIVSFWSLALHHKNQRLPPIEENITSKIWRPFGGDFSMGTAQFVGSHLFKINLFDSNVKTTLNLASLSNVLTPKIFSLSSSFWLFSTQTSYR